MNLFKRNGDPFTGTPIPNEAGKPCYMVKIACDRCHVINGERVWLMGIENGRPYSRTGFECWTCGNTGVRGERLERLYTELELARINKAAATREAKAAAKAAAAQDERDRELQIWTEANRPCLDAILLASKIRPNHRYLESAAFAIREGQIPLRYLDENVAAAVAILTESDIAAASRFVGEVGKRIELQLTCERVIDLSFGKFPRIYRFVHLMRDQAGNRIVYIGDSNQVPGRGESAKLVATVKGHEEYKGEQQTVIQRPKSLEEVAA